MRCFTERGTDPQNKRTSFHRLIRNSGRAIFDIFGILFHHMGATCCPCGVKNLRIDLCVIRPINTGCLPHGQSFRRLLRVAYVVMIPCIFVLCWCRSAWSYWRHRNYWSNRKNRLCRRPWHQRSTWTYRRKRPNRINGATWRYGHPRLSRFSLLVYYSAAHTQWKCIAQ